MNSKVINFDKVFIKHYQKRVLKNKKLHQLYKKSLSLFLDNPNNPKLRNHKLKGKLRSFRAFFIDDDCRVIYIEMEEGYLFLDIGKHDEVYK